MKKQYPSKYSNGKFVSAAQYITELICEKKAKIFKQDLHYRFWQNKEWSQFYRNQIGTANKLLTQYSCSAIVKALNSTKAEKIYSLRHPLLSSMIEAEEKKLESQNLDLTIDIQRPSTVKFNQQKKNSNSIISKLKDIDNGD